MGKNHKKKMGSETTTAPSREVTYPHTKALFKMVFLSPRWDMLVPWGVTFSPWSYKKRHAKSRGDFPQPFSSS